MKLFVLRQRQNKSCIGHLYTVPAYFFSGHVVIKIVWNTNKRPIMFHFQPDVISDIDECETNPCDVNGKCSNNPGSFECKCNTGYSGNGFVCTGTILQLQIFQYYMPGPQDPHHSKRDYRSDGASSTKKSCQRYKRQLFFNNSWRVCQCQQWRTADYLCSMRWRDARCTRRLSGFL